LSEGVVAVACCCTDPTGGWYEVTPVYCSTPFSTFGFPSIDLTPRFAMKISIQAAENLAIDNLKPIGELIWSAFDGIQMWTIGAYLGPDDSSLWDLGYEHPQWLKVFSNFNYDPDNEPVLGPDFIPGEGSLYTTVPPPRFSFVIPFQNGNVDMARVIHLSDFLLLDGDEWDPGIFPKGGSGFPSAGIDCAYGRVYNPAYEVSNQNRQVNFEGGQVCVYISDGTFNPPQSFEGFWTPVGLVTVPSYGSNSPPPSIYGEDYFFPQQEIFPPPSLPVDSTYIANPSGAFCFYRTVRIEEITIGEDCPSKQLPQPELSMYIVNSPEGNLHHGTEYSVVFPDDPCPGSSGNAPCRECEAPGFFPTFPGQGSVGFSEINADFAPAQMRVNNGVCEFISGQISGDEYFFFSGTAPFDPAGNPPYYCPEVTIVPQRLNGNNANFGFDNPTQRVYMVARSFN
jgi:hypothetical protein